MKRKTLLAIIFFLTVVKLPGYSMAKKPKEPRIKIIPESVDFGRVIQGEEQKFILRIENTGGGVLVIKRLTPGCECMEVAIEEKRIPAGKSSKVEVTMDTWDYFDDITKNIYVLSNDPEEGYKKIVISGNIEKAPLEMEISINPGKWNLGDMVSDKAMERELTIKNTGDKTIKISNIESSSELVKTSISSGEIKADDTSKVTIRIKPGEQKGMVKQHLYLTLDIPYEVYIEE